MKLLTFEYQGRKHAGVLAGNGVAPVEEINAKHGTRVPDDLLAIIRSGVDGLTTAGVLTLPLTEVKPRLPYDVPPKIWCIGLNYLSHAEDINAVQPEEPGSFMKPASCMFEPGGKIILPPKDISDDVDAEGIVPQENVADAGYQNACLLHGCSGMAARSKDTFNSSLSLSVPPRADTGLIR